jgi:hypothetical protein
MKTLIITIVIVFVIPVFYMTLDLVAKKVTVKSRIK